MKELGKRQFGGGGGICSYIFCPTDLKLLYIHLTHNPIGEVSTSSIERIVPTDKAFASVLILLIHETSCGRDCI